MSSSTKQPSELVALQESTVVGLVAVTVAARLSDESNASSMCVTEG